MPVNYGGFTWGQQDIATGQYSDGDGLIFKNNVLGILPSGASSGDWFAAASHAGTSPFRLYARSTNSVDFLSAYLTGSTDQINSVLIEGFSVATDQVRTLLYSIVVTPLTVPQQYIFNFLGVNEVRFTGIAGGSLRNAYIALDDFNFEGTATPFPSNLLPPDPIADVPAPSALILFGCGLAALFAFALRRLSPA